MAVPVDSLGYPSVVAVVLILDPIRPGTERQQPARPVPGLY